MALVELNKQAKKQNKFAVYIGEALADLCDQICLVGSRATCTPPPENTDLDVLCYIKDNMYDDFYDKALKEGWNQAQGYGLGLEFISMRKKGSDVNIISTSSPTFYYRFVKAMNLCKKLNLLVKEDRIAVHEAIMEGDVKVPKEWHKAAGVYGNVYIGDMPAAVAQYVPEPPVPAPEPIPQQAHAAVDVAVAINNNIQELNAWFNEWKIQGDVQLKKQVEKQTVAQWNEIKKHFNGG